MMANLGGINLLALFLAILATWTLADDCGREFRGKCDCGMRMYNYRPQYVVNCTDTGFRDTLVLEHLPAQTEVVIFNGNKVEELPWNVFGALNNLVNLTIVDMSNNHIREIRGKSYHHVPNVRRLILNHNNLSISRYDDEEYNHHHPRVFSNFINLQELHLTNAFADNTSAELSADLHDIFVNSNLTKLVKLHLEQNEISRFNDRAVFCDLPSLLDLHLGDNLLTELNFNLSCMPRLRFLDLERNRFEAVRPADLALLDDVQKQPGRITPLTVDFTYNPFVCDCSIFPLYEWLDRTNVTVRNPEGLVCFRNRQVREPILKLNVGKCRKFKTADGSGSTADSHTTTLIFVLICLSCVLAVLVAGLLYVSKDKLKALLTPVVDSVSKKVHYTTIKDEEAPEQYV
ncbi:leucine-rich transmembrane protein [Anopheles darlingi]|uniref:Leucine-rich transmembrane protein n=1 Tax=Anopheles darlingi TaxID=43151 RepID=W5JKY3_ANODA|nr:leucine-rich transmembrane protein [Anopheles darlingi]